MKLTAEIIESFAGVYLSSRYDSPQPTPDFHRECWTRYSSDHPACASAAPRNHAKSTALTHDFALANLCFRTEDYIILVGSSEELAIEHLGDIRNELTENEALKRDFKIKGFITEQKTDLIAECEDGHQFRIIARGAEQKIRGRKWRGKRPGLVLGDDLEDDEQVENKDRRRKFRRWFFRACKQALRDGGRIRVHGTILHEDSLLSHLIRNKAWNSKCYRAHKSFDDFREILWPEKFPVERLRAIRQEFINEGDSAGYSQEYLNDPRDNDEAYLRKDQFIEMKDDDYDIFMKLACGVDLAISKADTANRSSFTIGGKCLANRRYILDRHVGRMDALEITEKFFEIDEAHNDITFYVEDGQIWKAVEAMLNREMLIRDTFLSIVPLKSITDKKSRGRPFQKLMKAGACRYNKRMEDYQEYEDELLMFTGDSEALLDDQFDSTVNLIRGFELESDVDDEDTQSEEELAFEREARSLMENSGRSGVTGY